MYLKYVLVSVVITFVIFPITGCSFHPWSSSTNKNAVNFPDKRLEAVVRKEIGKPDGSILISDLEKITVLNARAARIADLSGLEYCINLKELRLPWNRITGFLLFLI